MGPVIDFLQDKYGQANDGLVPETDAFVPGAKLVNVHGIDHGGSVGLMTDISTELQIWAEQDERRYKDTPEQITEALVTIALDISRK